MGNGWSLEAGVSQPIVMTQQPAPMTLVELVRCGCKTGCARNTCSCRKNNLSCAASWACFLQVIECHNPFTGQIEVDTVSEDENDEGEEVG